MKTIKQSLRQTIKNILKRTPKMPRLKLRERIRFHIYLHKSLNKLNTKKNSFKPHWLTQQLLDLLLHKKLEMSELTEAIIYKHPTPSIISEANDNINLSLMIIDKLIKENK